MTSILMNYLKNKKYYQMDINDIKEKIAKERYEAIKLLFKDGIEEANKILQQDKILYDDQPLEYLDKIKEEVEQLLNEFKTGEENKTYEIRNWNLTKDFLDKYKEIEKRLE